MALSVKAMVDLIQTAEARIRPFVRETLIMSSRLFGNLSKAKVYFKCENLQHTGSFKVRGALNKILSLSENERASGVVAASTGNHGTAVAYALQQTGGTGIVFVPESASETKLRAISDFGLEVRPVEGDAIEAEVHARRFAEQEGRPYISPYNDALIVAGQGTVGVELAKQLPALDVAFIAVGGGGLIGGTAAYLKSVFPRLKIVGCSPQNSPVMARSVAAGQILEFASEPTLSDGTAGGIEPNAVTFELCRDLVDEFVTVTETEIAESLRTFLEVHHMLIEGAAAVPIAAFLKTAGEYEGKKVSIVLCGANIGLDVLKTIL